MPSYRPPLSPMPTPKHIYGMPLTTYKRVTGRSKTRVSFGCAPRNHGSSPLRNSIPICAGAAAPMTAAGIRRVAGCPSPSVMFDDLQTANPEVIDEHGWTYKGCSPPAMPEDLPAAQVHRVMTIKYNLSELSELPVTKQPSTIGDQVELMRECGDARIERAIARRKRLEKEERLRVRRAALKARAKRAAVPKVRALQHQLADLEQDFFQVDLDGECPNIDLLSDCEGDLETFKTQVQSDWNNEVAAFREQRDRLEFDIGYALAYE